MKLSVNFSLPVTMETRMNFKQLINQLIIALSSVCNVHMCASTLCMYVCIGTLCIFVHALYKYIMYECNLQYTEGVVVYQLLLL